METNKKLELLTGIVDEFNLSVNDVVSYWVKSGRLNLDAATVSSQVVSSGKYETPKRVLPGMYIYADGLIYPEIIEGRQVMAIVGSVDGSDVLAVCLQEACLPWSSDWLEARATQKMTGGKEATRKILEISRKKRQEAEAAQWCYDYAEGWSSAEYVNYLAWTLRMSDGYRYYYYKNYGNNRYVRPVLALKL